MPLHLGIDRVYSLRVRYSPSEKPIWHRSQEGDPYYIGKRYSDDLMEGVPIVGTPSIRSFTLDSFLYTQDYWPSLFNTLITSSSLLTILCCSARGGRGRSSSLIIFWLIFF